MALQALEFYFLNVSAAYMLIAVDCSQGYQKIRKKNCQIFVEIAQKVAFFDMATFLAISTKIWQFFF